MNGSSCRGIECHRTDHFELLSDDLCTGELLLFRCVVGQSQWLAASVSLLQSVAGIEWRFALRCRDVHHQLVGRSDNASDQ